MPHRVVITGMGCITPFGLGVLKNWDALLALRSCISPITAFDASDLPVRIGGQIDPALVAELNPEKNPKIQIDRASILTCAAIQEAIQSAKLLPDQLEKTGCLLGTGYGTIQSTEANYVRFLTQNEPFYPLLIPLAMNNAMAANAAIMFNLKGINQTIFTACSAGTNAIGSSYRLIKDGYADTLVAGGVDCPLVYYQLKAWTKIRAVSRANDTPEQASKPFCLNRDGFVLSEGAAFLVLERYDLARKRKANILAEIVGYGTNCDAKHITAPDPHQQGEAISGALADANLTPDAIDYISAHGTATKLNDTVETLAIRLAMGPSADSIPVSSLKSQTGHMIAASGALEVQMAIQMMAANTLLPTMNLTTPDPTCDLDYVPNTARTGVKIDYVLKNSFGFGGNNACLVLKRGALA